ncbi:hypothetical protein CW751_07165 [Brumimicrobium salinarum]|uniref:J domain-containing protein n=1 Tax=Brumimicrobium salinarum TaxID=2058658 RepID=A0A2I0R300_9FLAO|nr:DnaJ domain-containing protein [Brumimicrobium salinarum]PKR80939.1 hypothetical protein CW751_07165 [Brumimicrobium salinarum]
MSTRRYFQILGITPTKNLKVIKRAYRKMAMKYHPDRNPSAAAKDKFIAVNEAYERILLAIERGEQPQRRTKQSTRSRTTQQQTTQRRHTQRTTTKSSRTAEEVREEKMKQARKRYEQRKRYEAAENERYYKSLTTGKLWRRFKIIMFTCTFLSLLISMDLYLFPSHLMMNQISKQNTQIGYSGAGNLPTSPVQFENGQKAWITIDFIDLSQKNYLYLERSLFFKEIKSVKIWRNFEWRSYVPDYSLVSTYPLIPAILMFPLITFLIKGRTFTFSIFFQISYKFMPFFLLGFLISNDRWAHVISLGIL